jgi:hypothetical protein
MPNVFTALPAVWLKSGGHTPGAIPIAGFRRMNGRDDPHRHHHRGLRGDRHERRFDTVNCQRTPVRTFSFGRRGSGSGCDARRLSTGSVYPRLRRTMRMSTLLRKCRPRGESCSDSHPAAGGAGGAAEITLARHVEELLKQRPKRSLALVLQSGEALGRPLAVW